MTPSRPRFKELARLGKRLPVAACVALKEDPHTLFEALGHRGPCVLLESARAHPVTGRYSFLVGSPHSLFVAQGDRITWSSPQGKRRLDGNPVLLLEQFLREGKALKLRGFPPFIGGAVGFFGFEVYRYLEPSLETCFLSGRDLKQSLDLPDICLLFCDEAVVLDHLAGKLWVIALADPSIHPDRSYDEAVSRVEALLHRATRSPQQNRSPDLPCATPITSTHTRESFEQMVLEAKRFIADGEIYQANLSQRFSVSLSEEPWGLYRRLRAINPSSFAAYADFSAFQIVSASPERLLRVQKDQIETRPIAGTRPKGRTALETAQLCQELILNEKERAEHLMLVDLERNDLGRICRYGSVRVTALMGLEEYSHVIHIISNVKGTLRPDVDLVGLLRALFPGGTITGCPKIRSIEVIEMLEPVRRHLYTGALGYVSATGEADFNLLIRSGFITGKRLYFQTGAGIVADSDPGREYEETLHKAEALLTALRAQKGPSDDLVESASSSRAF